MTADSVEETLELALQQHNAGHLAQAEGLYRQVLNRDPHNTNALHLLGVLAYEVGAYQQALPLIAQAIEHNGKVASFHSNLGAVLMAVDRLKEAEQAYRQAIDLRPDYPQAYCNLGNVLHRLGRLEEAAASHRRALEISPEFAEAYINLGQVLQDQGRPQEAEASCRQALALNPKNPHAHLHLGNALQVQEQLDGAAASYWQALAINPNFWEACYNLGHLYRAQGKLEEAVASYRRAVAINPQFAEGQRSLGELLQESGRWEEAREALHRALEIQPEFAEAYCSLGNLHLALGSLEEAVAGYRRAVTLKPDLAQAHSNLGVALMNKGEPEAAVQSLQRGVDCDRTGNLSSRLNLVCARAMICDWRDRHRIREEVILPALAAPQADPLSPYDSLLAPLSPAEQLLIARAYARKIARNMSGARAALGLEHRPRHRPRLRIGYLSADFRDHATAHLMQGLFGRHDRTGFEIYTYSIGRDDGSPYRQRIAGESDQFIDIAPLDFVQAARRIFEDGIDILVDLKGYTKDHRLEIFALRPAPVQVTYLGHPGTLGADFIDYLLTDRIVTPPEQEPHFTERLVYLPDSYQINDSEQPIAEDTPTRAQCRLPPEGFVFCCFNAHYKLEPRIFEVWMAILRAVEGSVLWLIEGSEAAMDNLRREAQARGVSPTRLVFAEHLPKDRHLARHRLADLFLDTLVVNAHTTASDALWAGLPVLTCPAETFASRVGASLLTAMGLPELIAPDLAAYQQRAIALTRQGHELQSLKRRLEAHRRTGPLFDTNRFARHLETAFSLMWDRYMAGKAPGRIEVPPGALAD